jgi:ABC-type polysaccharide/polyol phosphate export permease
MAWFKTFFCQAKVLAAASMRARYRKTIAGFFWVVSFPIASLSAQALVFGKFLNIRVENYFLFLIAGLIPWIFVVQTIEMCTPIFVNSGPLLKSISISPLVYLSAQFLDNAANFLAGFLLILAAYLIFFGQLPLIALLLPLPMISLAMGVFGISLLLATVQVFYRDTRFVIAFVLQMAYYLTPIFYPIKFVPEGLRGMIALNPLYHLVLPFQMLLTGTLSDFMGAMLQALVAGTILLVAGVGLWRASRNSVYLYV